MAQPVVNVFFYGLFMDPDLVRQKGIIARNPRKASLVEMGLKVGSRATLEPEPGAMAHGVIMTLPGNELLKLYNALDLTDFEPIVMEAICADGNVVKAITYVMPHGPAGCRSRDYCLMLANVGQKVGLPAEYVRHLFDLANAPM